MSAITVISEAPWPTRLEAEAMALDASKRGFGIKLWEKDDGWHWIWKNYSGIKFDEASCDSARKEVAFVCALMGCPVFS